MSHEESSHESYEVVGSLVLNDVPFGAIPAMIEKNVSLRGFNLGASLHQAPRALAALFKVIGEGKASLSSKSRNILWPKRPRFTNVLKRAKPLEKLYSFRRSEERNHVLQHINLAAS
jgi:hypothetical protein